MGCCGADDDETQFDPRNKGPIKKRSCTDILCLLFFVAVVIAYIVVAVVAWLKGNPLRLIRPTDSQGQLCGVTQGNVDLSSKPYLFFFDLTECDQPSALLDFQCQTTQVCVSSCPSESWTYLTDFQMLRNATGATNDVKATEANVDWTRYICKYNYIIETEFKALNNGAADLQTIIRNRNCAPYTVPTRPSLGRCIPNVASTATSFLSGGTTLTDKIGKVITGTDLLAGTQVLLLYLNAQDIAVKIFSDFSTAWPWIIGGMAIAAFVAFLWIVAMRWFAGPIVWISIFAILGVIGFGIYYTYTEWQRLMNVNGSDTGIISVGLTSNLSEYLALQDTWLAFFIILCVVGGILLLLVIFLRKRIRIAIEIIKVASKTISYMISTLFYPIVTMILLLIVIVFWGATELWLASSGDPIYKVIAATNGSTTTCPHNADCNIVEWNKPEHDCYNNTDVTCSFITYGGTSALQQHRLGLQIAIVFILFWHLNWVIALGQCTLAGSFASYYWAFEKPKDIPSLPLLSAFHRTLRYHIGSLAFGSFLVALVQFIRVLLEYADSKLRGSENKVAKFFMCICKCCCWFLEKIMKFINRNAYIMIAIYGKNFCSSAGHAVTLIIRNVVRVVVVDKVSDFLLFVGKLFVVLGMVSLSWAFFASRISFVSNFAPSLNYYWMPIIIIGIGAYVVASGFFNVFGMAIDTTFLCFLEDLERNDGSPEKPYYMSKSLLKVLGKTNREPDDDDTKMKKHAAPTASFSQL